MPTHREILAVFFDYGGTLDANGTAWKERFYAIYIKNGLHFSPNVFDRAFYDADDSLTAEGISSLCLLKTVAEQVRRVLKGLGIADAGLNAKIADDFFQSSMRMIRTNIPVLKKLKKKYRLGIISNNYGNLSRICDDCGLGPLMDVVVDSNVVGCTKPDEKIFRFALDALALEPRQALMVGDSLKRDMLGAKAAGMPHVLLASRQSGRLQPCCPGDSVITKLSDLPELLP